MVYQNYIRGPLIGPRIYPITENHKENHARLLKLLKERDPEMYEKAAKILARIQEMAQNPEEAIKFEERRHIPGERMPMPVLELLTQEEQEKQIQMQAKQTVPQAETIPIQSNVSEPKQEEVHDQSQTQDFSQLEDEDLIGNKELDGLTLTLLKQKYGEKITVVEGKGEYYLNDPSEQLEALINDQGERIVIHYKGKLTYYDPVGVREYISCYEIIKEKMGQSSVTEVFTNISIPELNEPEYARAVAEFLLSDENLSEHNYGGYIGEIEKASVASKNATPIPAEPIPGWNVPRPPKYCIYYDPMALTAAKLLERQKAKDEKRPADGLGEFEPDASGR